MTMKTFEWKTDLVYAGGGAKRDKPVTQGWLHVHEDGAISVSPDDDYYHGEIDLFTARRIAEAVQLPFTAAEQAGYEAYVLSPSDRRDAKERDLYPEDQDLRIAWGTGWARAEIDAELGLDINLYVKIGGAGIGAILEAILKLKQGAAR